MNLQAATLEEGAERYRAYLIASIDEALSGAHSLQERASAHDLAGAKAAWIAARAGWERSEVFTGGFVPDLDEKIDAWPKAAAGFHAIEAQLFGAEGTNFVNDAKDLIDNLNDLRTKAGTLPLTPQGLLNGTAQLAYEVGESKSDGGESRISGTSLNDMRNNVAGIELAYEVIFAAPIEAADPKLAKAARSEIAELKALVAVKSLKDLDTIKLRQVTEELVITLQNTAPRIGLARPALEAAR